ncbi:putative G-protein gamma subunit [Ixodes scapularis]
MAVYTRLRQLRSVCGLSKLEMSTLQQQRKVVEQLRREAALKRMEVSTAIEDLKKYIREHENDDYLLVGFHSQKANPFREKSSCILL